MCYIISIIIYHACNRHSFRNKIIIVSEHLSLQDGIDWAASAAVSRDYNKECILFGFYDAHDLWHLFSGFAAFFSTMQLMTMDDELEIWPRDKIMTF